MLPTQSRSKELEAPTTTQGAEVARPVSNPGFHQLAGRLSQVAGRVFGSTTSISSGSSSSSDVCAACRVFGLKHFKWAWDRTSECWCLFGRCLFTLFICPPRNANFGMSKRFFEGILEQHSISKVMIFASLFSMLFDPLEAFSH